MLKTSLKYSNEIDWEYNLKNIPVNKKYNFNSSKKNNRLDTAQDYFNQDYANLKLTNNNNLKKSSKKTQKFNIANLNKKYTNKSVDKFSIPNNKPSMPGNKNNKKKSPVGIYYGILFILIFCFLFFLSISIGFASSKSINDNNDLNISNDDNASNILLEYLFEDANKNNEKKFLNENKIKAINFQKYRACKNDSYEKIAKKFGLSIDTILLVNNIKSEKILKVGAILKIPNQDGRLIKVQKNDSIFKISNRYGIKWQNIVDVNNIQSSVIIPGTEIFIPDSKMTAYERKQFYGYNFIWPIRGRITSYFGPRIDPFTKTYGFHSGIDIKNRKGAPVKCIKEGKVAFIGWEKVYGNFIIVKHENKLISIYAHLEKILVNKNQNVKQGEKIGTVGSSGRSTGPHLHLELRQNGKLVNPLEYLK